MTIAADLHLHSTASDGVLSPSAVMRRVAAAGLRAASLTDHDSMEGTEEAHQEAERLGLNFISGIELSAGDGRREIHVLGYGLDPRHEALDAHRRRTYDVRRRRVLAMVERLRSLGHDIRLEQALDHVGDGMPGRPHVARAMVDAGIVPDVAEAFRSFLAEGGAAFIPKPVFHVHEAIALIRSAGGVAVLAHPGQHFTDHEIAALSRAGLGGIEVRHPSHSSELESYYRRVAERFGLIATGGSDYHGAREGDEHALGQYGVEMGVMERLAARVKQHSSLRKPTCHAS